MSPLLALRVIRGVAPFWSLLADIVAKRIFASRHVRLVQEIDVSRKID
jgi:hypothetical protein